MTRKPSSGSKAHALGLPGCRVARGQQRHSHVVYAGDALGSWQCSASQPYPVVLFCARGGWESRVPWALPWSPWSLCCLWQPPRGVSTPWRVSSLSLRLSASRGILEDVSHLVSTLRMGVVAPQKCTCTPRRCPGQKPGAALLLPSLRCLELAVPPPRFWLGGRADPSPAVFSSWL